MKKAWLVFVPMWIFLLAVPVVADEVDSQIAKLTSGEDDEREEAAERLGQLRDPRAVPALVQALRDSEDEVVEKAAESLGQIGHPSALEPLLEVFRIHSANWGIRVKTARALELLGDPRALPALHEALVEEENPFVVSHIRRAIRTLENRRPPPSGSPELNAPPLS